MRCTTLRCGGCSGLWRNQKPALLSSTNDPILPKYTLLFCSHPSDEMVARKRCSLPSAMIWCSRMCVRKSLGAPLEYIQLSRPRWTGCNMAPHSSLWCQEDLLSLSHYLGTVRWMGADPSGQCVQLKCIGKDFCVKEELVKQRICI